MRKEQIEEMAEIMRHSCEKECQRNKYGEIDCEYCEAELLYNAGYRKQSEPYSCGHENGGKWISFDERLPTLEEQGRGIVGIVNGYNGKIRFENACVLLNYNYIYNEWYSEDYDIQNCKIDYWMPLPEPPKMKGGAK